MLDTNVCIDLFNDKNGIKKKIYRAGITNCCISEITIAELYYGLAKGSYKDRLLHDIISAERLFNIIPSYPSYKEYGEIRYYLERIGRRIDEFDLLIGATAVHNNLILVTANTKHFINIPDIQLENWVSENTKTI